MLCLNCYARVPLARTSEGAVFPHWSNAVSQLLRLGSQWIGSRFNTNLPRGIFFCQAMHLNATHTYSGASLWSKLQDMMRPDAKRMATNDTLPGAGTGKGKGAGTGQARVKEQRPVVCCVF